MTTAWDVLNTVTMVPNSKALVRFDDQEPIVSENGAAIGFDDGGKTRAWCPVSECNKFDNNGVWEIVMPKWLAARMGKL